MALLERVATLLRANVNDLLDRAENPSVMLKQLLRDMENQLLQVKTQVAASVADQHILQAKCAECAESATGWRRKATLALAKNEDGLARVAAERCVQIEQTLAGYTQQLADQTTEAEWLRDRYRHLEAKLADTAREGEMLLAAQRRATRQDAPGATQQRANHVMQRMRDSVVRAEATQAAGRQIESELTGDAETQLNTLERRESVDALLEELRSKPRLLAENR